MFKRPGGCTRCGAPIRLPAVLEDTSVCMPSIRARPRSTWRPGSPSLRRPCGTRPDRPPVGRSMPRASNARRRSQRRGGMSASIPELRATGTDATSPGRASSRCQHACDFINPSGAPYPRSGWRRLSRTTRKDPSYGNSQDETSAQGRAWCTRSRLEDSGVQHRVLLACGQDRIACCAFKPCPPDGIARLNMKSMSSSAPIVYSGLTVNGRNRATSTSESRAMPAVALAV